MTQAYHLDAFDYELPQERIALFPAEPRHDAALLVYDKGRVEHGFTYAHLPEVLKKYFPHGSPLLVFNDTRVFKARLVTQNARGQKVEVFLLSPKDGDISRAIHSGSPSLWQALIGRPARWKPGEDLSLSHASVCLSLRREGKDVVLQWTPENKPLFEVLEALGQVPLPPYIKRSPVPDDIQKYQTTYARETGSVAAPTAGLHFTESLLENLEKSGIVREYVTLHVGAGTFAPVREAEDIRRHAMHAEFFSVRREFLEFLSAWPGPVIPVGTTALRTLETLYWLAVQMLENEGRYIGELPQDFPYKEHQLAESFTYGMAIETLSAYCRQSGLSHLTGSTSLYIYPGYSVQGCDGLITNFHQPRSTLLMLVHAWVGDDWKRIYREALEGPVKYRFLSYGDGMLLLRSRNNL